MDNSENWCFVCKEGGELNLCDYKDCSKAYHTNCLENKELLTDPWICEWHSCSSCKTDACFRCFTCPRGFCKNCSLAKRFVAVRGDLGICFNCMKFTIQTEVYNDIVSHGEADLTTSSGLFQDYYMKEIKHRYGLNLQDILAAKKRGKGKLTNEDAMKSKFAAITAENLKLVYLKKSLLQELEKYPDTFEDKVRGAYIQVRRELNSVRELLPITGVKRSRTGRMTLLVSNLPRKLSLDSSSLSDSRLHEEECDVLMRKIEDGLIPKPTVTELQEKARALHVDITKHWFVRQLLLVKSRIRHAGENNLGLEELEKLLKTEKVLQDFSEQSRALQRLENDPIVKSEKQKVEGNAGLPESVLKRKREGDDGNLAEELLSPDDNTVPKTVGAFQSSNPFFSIRITQDAISNSYVCMPKEFVQAQLSGKKRREYVFLRLAEKRKSVSVALLIDDDSNGRLGSGWKRFAKENDVAEGSTCTFEWHDTISSFTVHVFI